ncbi:hypothetical protein ACFX1Q_041184 [Malus domestica]
MTLYLEKIQKQLEAFQTYTFTQVPWVDNAHADALTVLGFALGYQFRHSILIEYLGKPSIKEKPAAEVLQVNTIPSWQDPIIDYLVNETLPVERLEASNKGCTLLHVEQHSRSKILLRPTCPLPSASR